MRYSPWIVYNYRVRVCEPSATPLRASRGPSTDARRASFRPSLHLPFDRPLQAADMQHVGNNTIQRISYGVGIYSVGMHFDVPKPEAGGRGSSRSWRRRRRRIAPLRFFCANWPLRACVHSSLCYIPLRLARHFPAVRSGWPSPLHRRKCSGLSSCPTLVACPTVASAPVV